MLKNSCTIFLPYILQNFLRRSRYLLRSYSGECLGSSSDEERSELRYAIWIAEFRELLDLWTHAAFQRELVCSFTGVFYSSFVAEISPRICGLNRRSRDGVVRETAAGSSLRCELWRALLLCAPTQDVTAVLALHSCCSSVCTVYNGVSRVGNVWDSNYITILITRFNWSYPLNLSI